MNPALFALVLWLGDPAIITQPCDARGMPLGPLELEGRPLRLRPSVTPADPVCSLLRGRELILEAGGDPKSPRVRQNLARLERCRARSIAVRTSSAAACGRQEVPSVLREGGAERTVSDPGVNVVFRLADQVSGPNLAGALEPTVRVAADPLRRRFYGLSQSGTLSILTTQVALPPAAQKGSEVRAWLRTLSLPIAIVGRPELILLSTSSSAARILVAADRLALIDTDSPKPLSFPGVEGRPESLWPLAAGGYWLSYSEPRGGAVIEKRDGLATRSSLRLSRRARALFPTEDPPLLFALIGGLPHRIDPASGRELPCPGHLSSSRALLPGSDRLHFYSAGDDNTIRAYDIFTCREVDTWYGHRAPVSVLVASLDGAIVASGDEAGVVRLWEPETGEAWRVIDTGPAPIVDLFVEPSGRFLASAGADGWMRLFALPGAEPLVSLAVSAGPGLVVVRPDGRFYATKNVEAALRFRAGRRPMLEEEEVVAQLARIWTLPAFTR